MVRRGAIGQERRATALRDVAVRGDSDSRVFTGRAIVFGEWTQIGSPDWGFQERVMPGAADKTLREADVVFLDGHEPLRPISRMSAGTLRLTADEEALQVDSDLDTRISYVADLAYNVENRTIKGMSFGFRVTKDDWQTRDGVDCRTIREIELVEVSATAFPAYTATDAAVRSAVLAAKSKRGNLSPAEIRQIRGGQSRDLRELVAELRRVATEKRMTANDVFASLQEAVGEAWADDTAYAWVFDYDDAYVYFEVWNWATQDDDMYRQGYTLADDGMATLTGTAEQVRPRSLYVPVTDPDDSGEPPSGTRSRDLEPPAGTRDPVAALKLRMRGLAALHSIR